MEERKRPVGIVVLSVLHITGGILGGLIVLALMIRFAGDKELNRALDESGIPPALLIVGIIVLFSLAIASGFGMWRGAKWGWYLGSFYYLYGIARNLNALLMVVMLMSQLPAEELDAGGRGPGYYLVKHGVRSIIYLLIYLYFFKSNVRAFFDLSEQKKWKPVVVEVAICAVFWSISSLIAFLSV